VEVKRLLERLRAWTLGDDGTLRARASQAEPGEGLVLHVAMDNQMPPDLGPVRPYWRKLPPHTITWGTIAWADGDEWADRMGWPADAWLAYKADVEFMADHFQETVIACVAINHVIHDVYGDLGGVTPTVHRQGVHDVFGTPGARQAASTRWRRRVIAETYCLHCRHWHETYEVRELRDGLGGLISWTEPGDLIDEPLVVTYGPRPYFLHVETEREYAARLGLAGKTFREIAKVVPQLLPDLPISLRDGAPPWAVPGGQIDLSVANRWEVESDADFPDKET
jgi:hypothetical protein